MTLTRPGAARRQRLVRLHALFLAILPRVEEHGRIYFRHLRPHQKADAVQEMRALAWKWFLSLARRGKDPAAFLTAFTTYLARAVNSGRRLAGMAKAKDALNPATQKRHGFTVEPLPSSPRACHEHLYAAPRGQQRPTSRASCVARAASARPASNPSRRPPQPRPTKHPSGWPRHSGHWPVWRRWRAKLMTA